MIEDLNGRTRILHPTKLMEHAKEVILANLPEIAHVEKLQGRRQEKKINISLRNLRQLNG